MKNNSILNKAKHSENTDEWYTDYKTIEEEVSQYKKQFYNKVVLCNCDDPYKSEFAKYFLRNFKMLKIKKLICTSYQDTNAMTKQLTRNKERALIMIADTSIGDLKNKTDQQINDFLNTRGIVLPLLGDGDFRSAECVEYLKQADIVVTNPPFSKFKELFSLLVKYNKKYLIIGNQNATTYKEIFPYIKNGDAWIGYKFGDMSFKVPSNTKPRKTRFWIDESGQKWRSLGNAMWLTNLDTTRRHINLELTEIYDPKKYPKFDNYDAINVSRVVDIPKDYFGIMGVPLTYLKYHNDEQFEIIGEANHGSDNEFDLFKPKINGKEIYKRILIRNKKMSESSFQFNILDLFCGAGGMSSGMHKNPNFKTVVALDIEEKLAQTFKKNKPNVDLVIGDITDANIKQEVIKKSRQKNVNMIIGGPPCQGYALKGKKMGLNDPRNFLFMEYLSFVKELQPEVFVIENVKSLLSTSNGWFKEQILATIKEIGYHVDFGVIKASDFGVPQTRERAIFICCKKKLITLPKPTAEETVTVRDAISDLSYLDSNQGDFEQDYKLSAQTNYQMKMRGDCKKLYNHKASNHAQIAIDKLMQIPPEKGKEYLPKELLGKQQFKSTWGRLKWDIPSPTIDTRFDAASNGINNHPYLHRSITPREAARLQSFDDSYIFYGTKVAVRTQIGNAVPPLIAKAIADTIYQQWNK